MRLISFLFLGTVFPLAALLVNCSARPAASAPGATVKRMNIVQRITAAGRIAPVRKTLITQGFDGYVKQLYVKIGDHVRSGDPIVSISQTGRSQDEVYPLRAPFAGTVVQILATEGQNVQAQSAGASELTGVVRIDDLSSLLIETDVPESDVNRLRIGQDATFKAGGVHDRVYRAVVSSISEAAKDQKDRPVSEFTVQLRVIDPDPGLKPGMTALVEVITGKRDHVLGLSHEFLQRTADGVTVRLLSGETRNVQLGLQDDEVAELTAGLAEGDEVTRPAQHPSH